MKVVAVVGTGTGVGKTWVTCAVARRLRDRGLMVSARKPVQSFGPTDPTTDAALLALATTEEVESVCPPHRWYPLPMAPPMAAEALARDPYTLDELMGELIWPQGCDVGLVETVGGVCSPLADDADSAEVVRALAPDLVVLVADPGLGVISDVRTSAAVIQPFDLIVSLNRFDSDDEMHRRNRDWLVERDGYRIVTSADDLADELAR